MPLSKVTINIGSGGIGRRAANKDKISGLLFYNDNYPTGFSVGSPVKKVFSLTEAEALGIAEGSVNHSVEWYHISEYFRLNPEGELWIGIYPEPGTGLIGDYTYAELDDMQRKASGEMRQCGIFTSTFAFASSTVTTLQTAIDALITDGMPVQCLLAADMSAVVAITGWAAIGDLRALTAPDVTVMAGEDGAGAGAALAVSETHSVTILGAALGAISAAAVNESIGNPARFPASNGIELEVPALANGDLNSEVGASVLASLKDDGYQILVDYLPKIAGTYFERTPTAVASTDDFAWSEVLRPVYKASRLVDSRLTPELNSVLTFNEDGTLNDETISYLVDTAEQDLDGMVSDGEISAYEVTIDPTQDVLATGILNVTVRILPTGTAEFITVNIGLTNAI